MPIPWVPLAIAGAGAFYGGLQLKQAHNSYSQARETERFWADYRKNTGYSPRYPWRVGMYNNYDEMMWSHVGQTGSTVVWSAKSIYG